MVSRVNLPRPPFVTTSWQAMCCVIVWISTDYTDFHLPRGLKIRYSECLTAGQAGIDTKKEASEIQKPLSGDRRSRTDDPLLAKQML